MVDSSATTGRPVAMASLTSSDTWKNLLLAKSEALLEICLQDRSRVGSDVLGQLRSRAAQANAIVATKYTINHSILVVNNDNVENAYALGEMCLWVMKGQIPAASIQESRLCGVHQVAGAVAVHRRGGPPKLFPHLNNCSNSFTSSHLPWIQLHLPIVWRHRHQGKLIDSYTAITDPLWSFWSQWDSSALPLACCRQVAVY